MSKFSLPYPNNHYTDFNINPSFNQTKEQINALNHNKQENKIRKNLIQPSIYNDSEEQLINANNKYIQDKLNYINEHHKVDVSNTDESDLYDPIIEYDKQHNLIKDNLVQFYDYYIEINSKNREKELKINIDEEYLLSNNPFKIINNSNRIYIDLPENSNINQDDKILIQGIPAQTKTLQYSILNDNNYIIILKENEKYAMIKYNHQLDNTININYYCEIENLTNPPDNIYIGNIPLTYLNGIHKILLSISEDIIFKDNNNEYPAIYDENRFYIELPYKYIPGTVEDRTINSAMTRNFNLKLYYINNIPIYKLNAGYPQSEYQENIYYNVNIDEYNKYYFEIDMKINLKNEDYLKIGGDNVKISKIQNINYSNTNPNNYTIKLPRSYKNIVKVEIVGSEFPNIENNIYKIKNEEYDNNDFLSQEYFQNNKFYWQIYEDGSNYTYSIEIPPGKYTPELLKDTMEELIYNTSRIYYLKQQNNTKYTNHNIMNINFDINKNISSFKMFTEYIFNHAIKGLFYIHNNTDLTKEFIQIINKSDLPTDQRLEQTNPLFLLIYCKEHDKNLNNLYNKLDSDLLVNGDIIQIENINNYMNIPGEIINGEYEIYKIPDKMYYYENNEKKEILNLNTDNYFLIQLPNTDIFDKYIKDENDISNEGGLFICNMPLKFRLLFNTNDTIGNIIGFNNTGQQNSITQWNNEITNIMPYQSNVGINIENDTQRYLNFNGESYINIVCAEFPVFENIIGIDNIFARIMLKKSFNKINYNTFINNIKQFIIPINEINSLSFKFYNTKNILCDFGGVDHSFIIKITTINASSLRTNISSYTGTQI